MTLSIQYNKLRKRIKVHPSTNLGLPIDDIAYHMLNGHITSLDHVQGLLDLDDDDFTLYIDNALNMIDLD